MSIFSRIRDTITGRFVPAADEFMRPATTVAESSREDRSPHHFIVVITPPKGPKLRARIAHHQVIQHGPKAVALEVELLVERWISK